MSESPQQERYEVHVGRMARGAGISSFGQGVNMVLGYATQIALARMYGPALLGLYVLGMTVVQVANLLAQLGMNHGAMRYVAYYQARSDIARVRGAILMALWVTFALSLAFTILMFFGAGFLAEAVFSKPSLKIVIRAFSVSLPFFTVMGIALWATKGFQTMKYDAYVRQILRPLLNFVGIVIFYLLGAQLLGAVTAYFLSVALGAAFALYYLRRLSSKLLGQDIPPRFESRELLSFSLPMMVINFAQGMNSWSVIAVLGAFATAESVGIFNVAARTATLSSLVLTAFGGIFSPMVSGLYSRSRLEELSSLYRDVSRWIFTGGFAIFLITVLLAGDIMAVFGPEFVSGWSVMIVIAGGWLYSSSTGPSGRLLEMTGYQRIVMLTLLGSTASTLVLAIALVPRYGIMGAGVAVATGLIMSNTVILFFVKRRLGLWPYSRRHLKPFTAGLLAAVGTYLVKLALPLSTGIPTLLVIAPLFAACFVVLILALGLSPSDRQFVSGLWQAVLAHSPVRSLKRTNL